MGEEIVLEGFVRPNRDCFLEGVGVEVADVKGLDGVLEAMEAEGVVERLPVIDVGVEE